MNPPLLMSPAALAHYCAWLDRAAGRRRGAFPDLLRAAARAIREALP
jgi:hypothetical protein